MDGMKRLFNKCRYVFSTNRRFVLTTHISPDGDGIGCEVALALFLSSKGKRVSIINEGETPAYYRFMNSLFPITVFSLAKSAPALAAADVIIAVDTNSPSRFPAMKDLVLSSSAYKVCIDHHLEKTEFAELYLIDDSATATAEIVYDLLNYLDKKPLTKSIAEALYAAVMTDTGSFRFPKTDAKTHLIVADLLEHGADPARTYQRIFEAGSVSRLRLLGRALSSIRILHGGQVACMVLRREDFFETKTSEEDTDTMINHTLTIGGVKVGIMFVELEGIIKVSFRSKGNIPINELAKEFDGNGHKNAAGARIHNSSLDRVLREVTRHARKYVVRPHSVASVNRT